MNSLSDFLKRNIPIGIAHENSKDNDISKGKVKGYLTVLELIKIYEEEMTSEYRRENN